MLVATHIAAAVMLVLFAFCAVEATRVGPRHRLVLILLAFFNLGLAIALVVQVFA